MNIDTTKLKTLSAAVKRRFGWLGFVEGSSDIKTIATEVNKHVSFATPTNGKDPGTGSRIGVAIKRLFADTDPVGAFADRPRTLIFGNGVAAQSNRAVETGTTATTGAIIKAGSKTIPLVTGGAALISAVAGSKFAITLCSGQPWIATVQSVATDTITITEGLPLMARASAQVNTLVGGFWPATYRQNVGLISAANALLGSPLDVLPGHGHIGSNAAQVLQNLEVYLVQQRPDIVIFHLWENDINTSNLTEITRQAVWAARQCQMYGATPIFVSPVPSTTYTKIALFDQVVEFVLNIATTIPGAFGIDASTKWLRTDTPAQRQPLTGWTDNTFPNANKRFSVALVGTNPVYKQLEAIIGSRAFSTKDLLWGPNPMLAGNGGTATNLVANSVVAANTTVTADTGVTCTARKTTDGKDDQSILFTIAGASNITSTRVKISQAWSVPDTQSKTTFVKAIARIKINALSNISHAQMDLITNGTAAQTVSGFIAIGSLTDPGLVGKEIVVESAVLPMSDPSVTTLTAQLGIAPVNGLTNQCSGNIEVSEIGFVIVPQHELV